jgi:hypothetical protein
MTVPMPFELAEADPLREEREIQAERAAIQAEEPRDDISFDPSEFGEPKAETEVVEQKPLAADAAPRTLDLIDRKMAVIAAQQKGNP